MRQIHVCAWIALTLAACGGEEFSTPSTTPPPASAGMAGSEPLGNSPGSSGGVGGAKGSLNEDPEAHAAGASSGSGSGSSDGHDSESGGEGGGASEPDKVASDCPTGVVTFRMLPSAKLAPGYLCDAGCGTGWLSITDKDGATGLPISSACGTASCEACEVRQCAAAACLATPLTDQGSELTWDGAYLAKDTCGASKLVCQRRECVKPGKYKARACAAISADADAGVGIGVAGSCTPTEQRLCAEVEFDFPATKVIELSLGE